MSLIAMMTLDCGKNALLECLKYKVFIHFFFKKIPPYISIYTSVRAHRERNCIH